MGKIQGIFNESDKQVIKALKHDISTALVVLFLYDLTEECEIVEFLTKELRDCCCVSIAQQKKAFKYIRDYGVCGLSRKNSSTWTVDFSNNEVVNKLFKGVSPQLVLIESLGKEEEVNIPPLIKHWNSLPGTTNHTKPESKEWKAVRKSNEVRKTYP